NCTFVLFFLGWTLLILLGLLSASSAVGVCTLFHQDRLGLETDTQFSQESLGSWSGSSGWTYQPKPFISLNPKQEVTLGGFVTIWCQGRHHNMKFLLYNVENPNVLQNAEPAGEVTEFPIHNVSRRDAGSYSCQYRTKWDPPIWSEPSDSRELMVAAGRDYPKPPIWVSPSRVVALGGSVTICCESWYPGMKFFLRKAEHPNRQVRTVPDGTVAEFPIPSVGWEDGGSYTCEYHSITDQSRWSHPSDPIKIIVVGEGYPKPSISLSPSGGVSLGGAVTVWCLGQHRGMRFVLNKERRHFPPVDSDGSEAVFSISNVSREQSGSYSCYYHSRSEPFAVSYPSDPVELVVRGERPGLVSPFPAPFPARLSLGLGANGTLRASVTIRCDGWFQSMKFFLRKAGHTNLHVRSAVPDGTVAEFPIPSVSREDGGSYTCDYRSITDQSRWSHLSDPVEIIESWPPSPLLSPTRPHSPPRARDRTQESWLPAEKPGSEWTLETGLASHPLRSRSLGPQGLGLLRVSCC
uniref:Ig-like domain-containing protein n=1 Tax=Chrysemys picta bellii TaxID=8478 RepID=A0A8C3HIQ9_CHRPI